MPLAEFGMWAEVHVARLVASISDPGARARVERALAGEDDETATRVVSPDDLAESAADWAAELESGGGRSRGGTIDDDG